MYLKVRFYLFLSNCCRIFCLFHDKFLNFFFVFLFFFCVFEMCVCLESGGFCLVFKLVLDLRLIF